MALNRLAGIAAFTVLASSLVSAGPRADKLTEACRKGAAAEQQSCLERVFATSEAGLEAARKKARGAIEGGALTGDDLSKTLEHIAASDKAWAEYRASQCDAYGLYSKAIGEDGPFARWTCMINETANRQSAVARLFSSE
jgi:uncharacterized protein YecT (DUF1311 family)